MLNRFQFTSKAMWYTDIYRVVKEKKSIFLEVISIKKFLWTCVYFWIVRAVWISRSNSTIFFVCVLMNNNVYTRKADSRDELIPRIFFAAVLVKINSDENHATVDMSCKLHWGWQWNLGNFIVKCNKFFTFVLQVCHSIMELQLK
jgi:hypothetical protein